MKKIIVWGFRTDTAPIIEKLKEKNICEIVEWFGRSKDCTFHLKNINSCNINIPEYKKYDKKLYDDVFKDFSLYFACHNRIKQTFHRKEKFYDYIEFFNIYFQYFYELLTSKNVDMIIFQNIPHLGADYILYKMANLMNIKTVLFYQSLFPDKFFYFYSLDDFGTFDSMKKIFGNERYLISKTYKKDLFYMKKPKKLKSLGIFKIPKLEFFNQVYSLAFKLVRAPYILEYKNNLKKHVSKDIDFNAKFVYFPLHLQPELTTRILGGKYNDQALALERLSELIPDDWYIYVKENPKQTEYQRGNAFFKRLKSIKNLKLVPNDTNTYLLIEKCQFIATITGTAGWEAITGGKNVLTFGKAWYKKLPGVFEYSPDLDINDILNFKLNHDELENKFNELYTMMPSGIMDKDYKVMVKDFDAIKNNQTIADFLEEIILES